VLVCAPRVQGQINVFHSLGSSGLCGWDIFFHSDHTPAARDKALLDKIDQTRPTHIVHVPSIKASLGNVSLDVLDRIRTNLGIPVVNFHPDAAKPMWRPLIVHLSRVADLVVLVDGMPAEIFARHFPRPETKCLSLWTPVPVENPASAVAPSARNIDVSFIGSRTGYAERAEVLGFLSANGVTVFSGGDSHASFSSAEYYRLIRRSKIVLNFSAIQSRNLQDERPIHQIKGRVFDAAACGSFLLESSNPITSRYFGLGSEFDTFTDRDDALAKVRHYLANAGLREAMAERFHQTFLEKYHPRHFWARVFAEI
jgi:hypothetical protein